MKKYLTLLFILFSCSNVNQQSQEHYKEIKSHNNHGFIVKKTNNVNDTKENWLNPELAKQGRVVFQRRCASCHGQDAMGGKGPNLVKAAREIKHFSLFLNTSHWIGKMPGWQQHITSEETQQLAHYLKALSER